LGPPMAGEEEHSGGSICCYFTRVGKGKERGSRKGGGGETWRWRRGRSWAIRLVPTRAIGGAVAPASGREGGERRARRERGAVDPPLGGSARYRPAAARAGAERGREGGESEVVRWRVGTRAGARGRGNGQLMWRDLIRPRQLAVGLAVAGSKNSKKSQCRDT
jgi:hypothetical protein